MGIVYSQAVVTIAASASTSVHGGCFNQQSVSHLSHMRYKLAVRTTTFDGDETELLVYETYEPEETPPPITKGALAE